MVIDRGVRMNQVELRVTPKTYALLIGINIFNTDNNSMIDSAYRVNVKDIRIDNSFVVNMVLDNYEAFKMYKMLIKYPFQTGVKQQVDKICLLIVNHLEEYNKDYYKELSIA